MDALGDKLYEAFQQMIQRWFLDVINNWISELAAAANDMIGMALHIEDATALTSGIVSDVAIGKVFFWIYLVLLGFLAVKLCWKGYKIYVLDLDGDADISPLALLKNAIYALCVAVAFPVVYDITAELVQILGDKFFGPFSTYTFDNFITSLQSLFSDGISRTFIFIILALVYVFVAVFLWVRMVMQGWELLIFRLGVPLAVVGLIDSDGGIWKGYIQQFIRQMTTILIQGFCVKLSIVIAMSATGGAMVSSIALLLIAFKMPKMISSLVVSGGGGSGTLHTLSMVARTFIKGG